MMSWNTSTDCCNWDGVECDDSTGDVIELDLHCGMLQGTIHPNTSLFNLPHLIELDLSYNGLNGTLPSWLFTSPSLQYLSLRRNMFSGNVPFESFALPSLKELYLNNNNQLSGQIDVGQLTNLTNLDLSFNNFSGECELDTLLSTLTNLEDLHLSYIGFSFTGDIPSKISANLTHLTYLDLSYNQLNGTLPSWLFTSPSLQYLSLLDLSYNSLSVTTSNNANHYVNHPGFTLRIGLAS
ncbi:leucine-rich repeat-containing protein [Tanacetum coccineum]